MAVIGVNGSGKTSLLDAFSLLSASAEGNLSKKLSELGGISNILTRGKSEVMEFSLEAKTLEESFLKYEIRLATQGAGHAVIYDTLRHYDDFCNEQILLIDSLDGVACYRKLDRGENYAVEDTFIDSGETALSQVPKTFTHSELFRRILANTVKYQPIDVGPRSYVRLPQQMNPTFDPGMNGEDLLPFLYNIRETSQDKFEIITDTMRAAFPDFKEFGFPPVAAGMLTMTWKDSNFTRPLYINELSDGTLRFLWLASLLQSPTLPSIMMIDEPDISLHPQQMNLLVDLMREASGRTRLVIATHSDRIVRFVKPEELMVFDIDEEGGTSATYADSFDLEKWLSKYRLDELWSMGHLTL